MSLVSTVRLLSSGYNPLRCPVQSRLDPRRRPIAAHPEHALRGLDLIAGAPAGHECARKCGIEEIDRERIAEHSSHPRGRQRQPSAIFVEPSPHLVEPTAKSFKRDANPDAAV